jgi:hypothetical protein
VSPIELAIGKVAKRCNYGIDEEMMGEKCTLKAVCIGRQM